MLPGPIRSMPLVRRPEPFSHPDWLFEVKHDGFRALAYVYIEARGEELFVAVCMHDLEGIVAKWKHGKYAGETTWVKIKNPAYSQIQKRHEQFDRMRKRATSIGQ